MSLGRKLTPYRRQALERLRDHGPLTIEATFDGHPNHMPTLIACGWVRPVERVGFDWRGKSMPDRYEITEAGRDALQTQGSEAVTP